MGKLKFFYLLNKNMSEISTFLTEPLCGKPCSVIPGLDASNAEKLSEAGYSEAFSVVGMFLRLGKKSEKFREWISQIAEFETDSALDLLCHAVQEWARVNIG